MDEGGILSYEHAPTDAELEARIETALKRVSSVCDKHGFVGARDVEYWADVWERVADCMEAMEAKIPSAGLQSSAAMVLQYNIGERARLWHMLKDLSYDGDVTVVAELPTACTHDWVDTGMRWTYCRHCNMDGEHLNGTVMEKQS